MFIEKIFVPLRAPNRSRVRGGCIRGAYHPRSLWNPMGIQRPHAVSTTRVVDVRILSPLRTASTN